MTTVGRGIRNATRTVSIILILGLAIGLAIVMLIAHLHGVTGLDESLNSAAQTLGTTHNPCPKGALCHVTKSFRSGDGTGAIIILFTMVMIVRERRTGHLHRLLPRPALRPARVHHLARTPTCPATHPSTPTSNPPPPPGQGPGDAMFGI